MDKDIMKNDKVELQPWDADHYSVLNVCICGKHHNDSVPIKELIGANVCIHYVDEKDDIIKRWQPTTGADEAGEKLKDKYYSEGYRQGYAEGLENGKGINGVRAEVYGIDLAIERKEANKRNASIRGVLQSLLPYLKGGE